MVVATLSTCGPWIFRESDHNVVACGRSEPQEDGIGTRRNDLADTKNDGNADCMYFVLDTNVLLHNPGALFSFGDNCVVIQS